MQMSSREGCSDPGPGAWECVKWRRVLNHQLGWDAEGAERGGVAHMAMVQGSADPAGEREGCRVQGPGMS